jgi:hypothetical protein
MAQIKAGSLQAVDACNALLDKAALDPSGPLVNAGDAEAKAILNNLNTFHRSWFPRGVVEQITNYSSLEENGTGDLYDTTEPALALTRAMFANGAKYSDVLTLSTGVHGMRYNDPAIMAKLGWVATNPLRRTYGATRTDFNTSWTQFMRSTTAKFNRATDPTDTQFLTMPTIEAGELIGIRPTTESVIVPNTTGPTQGNFIANFNYSYNFYKTYGGGVLGSPSYLIMNNGHGEKMVQNGGRNIYRDWSMTNMNVFMCATMPTLREADVASFVVSTSSLPFRHASSCVMCHATLDPMAYTTRNIIVGLTDQGALNTSGFTRVGCVNCNAKNAHAVTTYQVTSPSVAGWPSEPTANFQFQTPAGRLYYRSLQGQLIDVQVTGVDGLGAAMTAQKDYYQCAAKRYFEYMTGIKVALYDTTDPRNVSLNQSLTAADVKDRAYVESLADQLQSSQSVRAMIKTIMASAYYRDMNYRP